MAKKKAKKQKKSRSTAQSKKAASSGSSGKKTKVRRKSKKVSGAKKSSKKKASSSKAKRSARSSTSKKRTKSSAARPTRRKKGEKYQVLSPAKIKVVGIGGAGGNIITRMSASPFKGVEFVAINTDVQDLNAAAARRKVHIGKNLTRGLGAGMNPDLGKQAAEENRDEIMAALEGADMIFITAGMGGGTGSFGSSVVADAAQKTGALTIGVVTKPFHFEGAQRMKIAEDAVERLKNHVDALIVIPNDKIFSVIDPETPIVKAFEKIDDILRDAVRGISELVTFPGIINVDFADVRAVMQGAGTAVVGSAHAGGKDRALKAAKQAVSSPLVESGIDGARGILFGIAGGRDMKMSEINEAAKFITEAADSEARIIFGAYHDRRLKSGTMRVTVLAAGFDGYAGGASRSTGLFDEEQIEVEGELIADDRSEQMIFRQQGEGAGNDASSNASSAGGDARAGEDPDSDDMWDIPAFLRRKK